MHLFFPILYIIVSIIQIKIGFPIYSANKLISKNAENFSSCKLKRSFPWSEAHPAVKSVRCFFKLDLQLYFVARERLAIFRRTLQKTAVVKISQLYT